MTNAINKKLSELLGKMDDKVLQVKLNSALDMLKNSNPEELAKKLKKIDKDEIMGKIDEIDQDKLKELNIDVDEIKSKITEADLAKLSNLIGDKGDEIVNKIKELLNKCWIYFYYKPFGGIINEWWTW